MTESSDDGAAGERLTRALEDLLRDGTRNAVAAWLLTAVLAVVLLESAASLDLEWTAFVAVAAVVVVLPPASFGSWRAMPPWELLGLALLPILARGLFGSELGTFPTYLSLAGLALLIVVELHAFTDLQLTHWFAIGFVTLTTLAAAGASAMLRYGLDLYAGTSYLTDNDALMTEFLWVAIAGVAAGALFDAYFRRRDQQLRRALGRVISR